MIFCVGTVLINTFERLRLDFWDLNRTLTLNGTVIFPFLQLEPYFSMLWYGYFSPFVIGTVFFHSQVRLYTIFCDSNRTLALNGTAEVPAGPTRPAARYYLLLSPVHLLQEGPAIASFVSYGASSSYRKNLLQFSHRFSEPFFGKSIIYFSLFFLHIYQSVFQKHAHMMGHSRGR